MHNDEFKLITHGDKSLEFLRGGMGVDYSQFDSKISLEGNGFKQTPLNQQANLMPSMKVESIMYNNKPDSAPSKNKIVKNTLKSSNTQNTFRIDSSFQKTTYSNSNFF